MRPKLGRPNIARYSNRFSVPTARSDAPLSVTWMGVATLLVDDGSSALMTDGYFSRPGLARVAAGKVSPSAERVDGCLARANVSRLTAVIPVHTHIDHAMDSALVADRTGAQLVGGESAANVVLVLAKLCDDEGLFEAAGAAMARASAESHRLLRQVFAVSAAITAALCLDATVVLLTPVVLATVRRLRTPVRPYAYATAHLANAASLLLPVSNLTNLLAYHGAGISFTKFTLLMALPWLSAVAAVYVVFRWFFARDLRVVPDRQQLKPAPRLPMFVLVVVALTLGGFAVAESVGLAPTWAALAGAAVLALRSLRRGHTSVLRIARAVNVSFLVFVLALGVVVHAVMLNGMAARMSAVLPTGSGLPALLGIAALAAVLANVVNNLPATLVLVPLVAAGGPAAVLAVLLGVNIGPNLTYAGSLSNLLWRGVLRRHNVDASVGEYTRLGLCTVPAALAMAVLALWASAQVLGI